jgi:polysaccharide biosynthesis transport protein
MKYDPTISSKPPLSPGDIYYVLFKHKWKIIFLSLVGVLAAGAAFKYWPVSYVSEASLFIRYVQETATPAVVENSGRIKTPDQRGETIMNNERAILTSLDLAQEVAEAFGPERLLGADANTVPAPSAGAAVIRGGLTVESQGRSSVMRLVFEHPNREIVQPVLRLLVEEYLKKHEEIHRSRGLFDEFLSRETDQLRARLQQTENELRKVKWDARVYSLDEARKTYAEQIANLRQDIFSAEVELAERKAMMGQLAGSVAVDDAATAPEPEQPVPADKIVEYRQITRLLDVQYDREQNLILHFKPESERVKALRGQIADVEKRKAALDQEFPRLATMNVPARTPTSRAGNEQFDRVTEGVRVDVLEFRLRFLKDHMATLTREASALNEAEPSITELQRRKEIDETRYRSFLASLEQARIEEALGAGRISNISVVQNPSPPSKQLGDLYKVVGGLLLGGFFGSIGLAFFRELYVDRSLRRPIDVESSVAAPLFLSIPLVRRWGSIPKTNGHTALLGNGGSGKPDSPAKPKHPLGKSFWRMNQRLSAHLEALRDRLILHFEINDMTRKPKLVAITSCGEDAGVSTIAAGLAASLSETDEGNVLLVDMNHATKTPYQFHKGVMQCELDQLLEKEDREEAQVQQNLYLAAHTSGNGKANGALRRRFNHLVPKLKASDYDYIIFDMPPVSQISLTPRLARFMDIVLLVAESEKTNADTVQRATALLSENQTTVGVVLNKTRRYVPRCLEQEI